MIAILLPIKPKWCALEMNGKKTIEVRKENVRKAVQKLIDKYGFADIYAYCTRSGGNLLQMDIIDDNVYAKLEKDCDNEDLENSCDILNGKVLFKFRCYKVEEIEIVYNQENEFGGYSESYGTKALSTNKLLSKSQLDYFKLAEYLNDYTPFGCAIHVSELEIFDKPKELSEFYSIVKEKVKIDCPLNRKGWCITNYDCKYYVEDDSWGGKLACSCPTKEIETKKPLTKAPQSFCYIEVLE